MRKTVDPEKPEARPASLIAQIRRQIGDLRLAGLFAAVAMVTGHQLLADLADPAPLRGLEEVSHAQVELRGGFWGPRLKTHHEVTVPHAPKPLKVFILAGQSNMDGQANVSTIDFLGEDKQYGYLLKTFKPDGKTLVTRDDVWVAHRGVYGKLGPGYGGRRNDDRLGNNIGPEYAFGYFMGEALDEQVLLIKYATGGQSLYQNFHPPSAGLPEPMPANTKPEDFGNQYRSLLAYVHETLDNLKRHFPGYDEKAGYEIVGFVWFQGYNDLFVPEKDRKDYGKYLVCLIHDLRKEFKVPQMRVVVGVMGVNGPRNEIGKQKDVRDGQRSINDVPEFKGTVKAIETAPLLHPKILELQCAGWLYPERDLKSA